MASWYFTWTTQDEEPDSGRKFEGRANDWFKRDKPTHLAVRVALLLGVLGVQGVGQHRVQADTHLFLTIFFVLELVGKRR